jgi:hypothetical protein
MVVMVTKQKEKPSKKLQSFSQSMKRPAPADRYRNKNTTAATAVRERRVAVLTRERKAGPGGRCFFTRACRDDTAVAKIWPIDAMALSVRGMPTSAKRMQKVRPQKVAGTMLP